MTNTTPTYVACIGSRETPIHILRWMQHTGEAIVRAGYTIVSGNAPGADQAWAQGGNRADPSKVVLCLPWNGFEEKTIHPDNIVRILDGESPRGKRHFDRAEAAHDAWHQMTPGGQRLHARNAMIVDGALAVFGYVNGGGTRTAFKLAQMLGVPTYDVRNPAVQKAVLELVAIEHKAKK